MGLCKFAIAVQFYINSMSEKLHAIDSVLGDRIIEKAIIYAGEFEDNTTSKIKLLNYKNMHSILS